ncbi:Mob1/phocein [Fimicolochytrium jonesii]|uniref:Mob1/phocein n=1 Tax=Fimicolochytrium jonesii TaxID=1396493 RepID=UPI0022FEE635|nr:Mob1/phocein [Fimicolochytrium jonesii]KAI8816831.1 Mob1/phocein [Fimicolochytrium jonesii]
MNFFGSKFGKSKGKKDGIQKPLWLNHPFVEATLVNGSLRKVVALPRYVDVNEWLAVNSFDFFNYTNLFYGAIAEFCTPKDCPVMCAGQNCEYTWTDGQKRTIKIPAPQYVDYVMTWIQNVLNDENVFPTKSGYEFPREFQNAVRTIFKQLFRIFAHIYHHHYDKILHVSAEGHLNTLFAHFISFAREFDLIDKKEIAPMADFIAELDQAQRI